MARYLVERTFPDGLAIPMTDEGTQACLAVVGNNAVDGVTWVHSYVTSDKKKTFCIYDAPSPEAIRTAAKRNNLPVDSITRSVSLIHISTSKGENHVEHSYSTVICRCVTRSRAHRPLGDRWNRTRFRPFE